jgi:hypothetical protein
MENGISVYSDLNRFKKNFRLISCTLLKNSAKYGCITNIHNHSGQGARILGIRPFKANSVNRKRKIQNISNGFFLKEIRRIQNKFIKRGLSIPNEYQQTKYHSTNRK